MSTTSEALRHHFSMYGTVEDAFIVHTQRTRRHRGFGFVQFLDNAVADFVLTQTHVLHGTKVTIRPAEAPARSGSSHVAATDAHFSASAHNSDTVFVGGLPHVVDESAIRDLFNKRGRVISVSIIRSRHTNRSRGFAYVRFASSADVNAVLGNDYSRRDFRISGKLVEVKRSLSREEMVDESSVELHESIARRSEAGNAHAKPNVSRTPKSHDIPPSDNPLNGNIMQSSFRAQTNHSLPQFAPFQRTEDVHCNSQGIINALHPEEENSFTVHKHENDSFSSRQTYPMSFNPVMPGDPSEGQYSNIVLCNFLNQRRDRVGPSAFQDGKALHGCNVMTRPTTTNKSGGVLSENDVKSDCNDEAFNDVFGIRSEMGRNILKQKLHRLSYDASRRDNSVHFSPQE